MCVAALPLAIAATALSAVGTGVSALSTASQQTYQARVADRNARMEEDSRRDAIDRSKIEARRQQQQSAQVQGAQRAALAANGIDIDFGSAAALRADTVSANAEDALMLARNGEREARGFEINAANFTADARASRSARTGTLVKGGFDFGSTILGGAKQYRSLKAARYPGGSGKNAYGITAGDNIY